MHPEEIKAGLRIAGVSPAMLADELKVSASAVSQTINGQIKSERIQKRISQILQKPISVIWPKKKGALRRTSEQIKAQRHSGATRRAAA